MPDKTEPEKVVHAYPRPLFSDRSKAEPLTIEKTPGHYVRTVYVVNGPSGWPLAHLHEEQAHDLFVSLATALGYMPDDLIGIRGTPRMFDLGPNFEERVRIKKPVPDHISRIFGDNIDQEEQ